MSCRIKPAEDRVNMLATNNGRIAVICWQATACPWILLEHGRKIGAFSTAASGSKQDSEVATVQKFPPAMLAAMVGPDTDAKPSRTTTITTINLFMSDL